MGRRGYPLEFRRKVLDLIEAGRKVADVADDLGISDQTIYTCRRQDRIDRGLESRSSSAEKAELEAELVVHRRATELLKKEAVPPKARYAAIAAMTEEGLPAQLACRVLGCRSRGSTPGDPGRRQPDRSGTPG